MKFYEINDLGEEIVEKVKEPVDRDIYFGSHFTLVGNIFAHDFEMSRRTLATSRMEWFYEAEEVLSEVTKKKICSLSKEISKKTLSNLSLSELMTLYDQFLSDPEEKKRIAESYSFRFSTMAACLEDTCSPIVEIKDVLVPVISYVPKTLHWDRVTLPRNSTNPMQDAIFLLNKVRVQASVQDCVAPISNANSLVYYKVKK